MLIIVIIPPANLQTAIAAVRSNMGLAFFAYNNLLLTFLWSVWWTTAFVATTYVLSNCNAEGYCEDETNGFLVFLLLVSFFWTAQVLQNVVHVTVAGTVGTWCTLLAKLSCPASETKTHFSEGETDDSTVLSILCTPCCQGFIPGRPVAAARGPSGNRIGEALRRRSDPSALDR
jgi:Plasma-membrane choline transporter